MANYIKCPVCRRLVQLKKDGTVRHHGGEVRGQWPYGREYRCPGVGLDPLPDDAVVPL